MEGANVDVTREKMQNVEEVEKVPMENYELKRPRKDFENEGKDKGRNGSTVTKAVRKAEISEAVDMSKKEKSMGLIFMCNAQTKSDCFRYNILGLPASKRELVSKVYKGMRLFLFDIDLRLLYGIFKATEPGGFEIEPKAFKSAYPSQVRFRVYDDCLPLPEERFKAIIKDNYYTRTKFDGLLTAEQMKNMCKLFQTRLISSHDSRINRLDVPMSMHHYEKRGRGLEGVSLNTLVEAQRPPARAKLLERGTYTPPTLSPSLLDYTPPSLLQPLSPSSCVYGRLPEIKYRRTGHHSIPARPFEQIVHNQTNEYCEFDDRRQLMHITRGPRLGIADHELTDTQWNPYSEQYGHYLAGSCSRPEQVIDDPHLRVLPEGPQLELHDHRITVLRRDGRIELQDRQLTNLQARLQNEIGHARELQSLHQDVPPWRVHARELQSVHQDVPPWRVHAREPQSLDQDVPPWRVHAREPQSLHHQDMPSWRVQEVRAGLPTSYDPYSL